MWCWRRLLRVPWTARRSNQSVLQEISPEYTLEGLMLKLQYFGHLMWRIDSSEKTLMLGGWMPSQTRWTWVWTSSGSWWWTGKPSVLQSMGSQRVGHDWVTELNWLKLLPKVWKEVKDFYSNHPCQHHIGAKSQSTKVRKRKDIQIEKGETKLSNCRRQDSLCRKVQRINRKSSRSSEFSQVTGQYTNIQKYTKSGLPWWSSS